MHLKSLFLSSANTGFNTRSDGDDSVCDGMLEPEKFPYIARQSHTRVAWPWILSTILFAVISILLYFQPRTTVPCQSQSSYEGGFLTDFQDAKQVIALEQRVFDSALYFNESSRLVEMEMNSQFVGPPSPKIDLAWNNLMLGKGRFFPVTEQEASAFPELTTLPATGKYYMELDTFHSLHCLNDIRRELDHEYYSQHDNHHSWEYLLKPARIHMDHCIDQLRQTIQCSGDLTPVALYFSEGSDLGIGRSATHTCRSFDKIHSWVSKRDFLKGY